MAKAWVWSDLHQEFCSSIYGRDPRTAFDPARHAPADFDMVLVAGDVSVPLASAIDWLADRLPGVPVCYTPGNHDYYNKSEASTASMKQMLAAGRERAAKRGVHLVSDDVIEIAGIRVIGATLWTDFSSVGDQTLSEKIRNAAGLKGMNDYRSIWYVAENEGPSARLHPAYTIAAHHVSRRFIENSLLRPYPGKTLVMTHHAPSRRSLNPRFGGTLDYCFASDLEDLLLADTAPSLWVHGHVHHALDYYVGRCRVVCNPRGYAFMGATDEGRAFSPSLVVEIA